MLDVHSSNTLIAIPPDQNATRYQALDLRLKPSMFINVVDVIRDFVLVETVIYCAMNMNR